MIIQTIIESLLSHYNQPQLSTATILSVLLAVLLLSIYEFFIYRTVSHRAFYNRSFNISLTVFPFFIAAIILALQSNLVITLGTIGALAILRYRTAIKDPTDMLYLLWAVFIGIVCGCQLYELGVLTSIAATLVLLVMEHLTFGKRPLLLIIHDYSGDEADLTGTVSAQTRRFRFKNRTCTAKGTDYVLELSGANAANLIKELKDRGITNYSLIEYDNEDLI